MRRSVAPAPQTAEDEDEIVVLGQEAPPAKRPRPRVDDDEEIIVTVDDAAPGPSERRPPLTRPGRQPGSGLVSGAAPCRTKALESDEEMAKWLHMELNGAAPGGPCGAGAVGGTDADDDMAQRLQAAEYGSEPGAAEGTEADAVARQLQMAFDEEGARAVEDGGVSEGGDEQGVLNIDAEIAAALERGEDYPAQPTALPRAMREFPFTLMYNPYVERDGNSIGPNGLSLAALLRGPFSYIMISNMELNLRWIMDIAPGLAAAAAKMVIIHDMGPRGEFMIKQELGFRSRQGVVVTTGLCDSLILRKGRKSEAEAGPEGGRDAGGAGPGPGAAAAAGSAPPKRFLGDRRGPLRGDRAKHHSKFFLLFYPGRGLRVVIPSSNYLPGDAGAASNSIFFQDFPLHQSSPPPPPAPFAATLVAYLQKLNLPLNLEEEATGHVTACDFSSARAALITSIPGPQLGFPEAAAAAAPPGGGRPGTGPQVHPGAPRTVWGMGAIAAAVQQEQARLRDPHWPLPRPPGPVLEPVPYVPRLPAPTPAPPPQAQQGPRWGAGGRIASPSSHPAAYLDPELDMEPLGGVASRAGIGRGAGAAGPSQPGRPPSAAAAGAAQGGHPQRQPGLAEPLSHAPGWFISQSSSVGYYMTPREHMWKMRSVFLGLNPRGPEAKDPYSKIPISFVWPTVRDFAGSERGLGGNQGFCTGKSFPTLVKNYPYLFYPWAEGAAALGRSRVLPHLKMALVAVPGEGGGPPEIPVLYTGAHNMSIGAWGGDVTAYRPGYISMTNFEMGVLFTPSLEALYRVHPHWGFSCTPDLLDSSWPPAHPQVPPALDLRGQPPPRVVFRQLTLAMLREGRGQAHWEGPGGGRLVVYMPVPLGLPPERRRPDGQNPGLDTPYYETNEAVFQYPDRSGYKREKPQPRQ